MLRSIGLASNASINGASSAAHDVTNATHLCQPLQVRQFPAVGPRLRGLPHVLRGPPAQQPKEEEMGTPPRQRPAPTAWQR